MKKLIHTIPIVFLFLFLPSLSQAALFCDITVQSSGSITTAIGNAGLDDVICIEPGTYKENITLNDGITIQGLELARTIIEGDGTGTGSVVTAANSTTIMNVTITNSVTSNSAVGIAVTGLAGVKVNNVIIKNNATGINCSGSINVTVDHAVIDHNTTGIGFSGIATFSITNSIISNNATDLSDATFITDSSNHNLTFNNTPTKNYPTRGIDLHDIIDSDPLFVAPASNVSPDSNDYHLQTGSPARDKGSGTDPDGPPPTPADIGAYGGPNMDTKPFPVDIDSASEEVSVCSSPRCIKIDWSANNAYNIAGYKVHFDSDASGAPYSRTTDAGNVTTYTLTGLSVPDITLVPTGVSTKPGNGKISVSWNAVPGAKGYIVNYRISTESTSNSIDVGNSTSAVITGLTNNTLYSMSVRAYFQTTYYLSVSAFDGKGNESALVEEKSVELLGYTEGPQSDDVKDFPEETAPFPDLGDENKCFIATAAYGSPMEPQVILLRKFRDRFLLPSAFGKKLVSIYYDFSPPLADYIRQHAWLKPPARVVLLPFIGIAAFCLKLSFAQLFLITVLLTVTLTLFFLVLKRRARE